MRQKQGVPEHDGILDQHFASGRYLLLLTATVLELLVVGEEHCLGKFVSQLDFVQLLLDALAQL